MSLSHQFSLVADELCYVLSLNSFDSETANRAIDELIAKPYNTAIFVPLTDGEVLLKTLYVNIKPENLFLVAKASHLINNITTKQNLKITNNLLQNLIEWHVNCLNKCSEVVLPDILHNLQCILNQFPQSAIKFSDTLLNSNGILIKFINIDNTENFNLSLCLLSLKCISSLTKLPDEKAIDSNYMLSLDIKEILLHTVIKFLMNEIHVVSSFIYYKAIIYSLRILAQLYLNNNDVIGPLPEVMGICNYFVLYGLIPQQKKPEKILPSQQTIATPIVRNPKGGKKQRIRKQRNNAIETLKKDLPISDKSLAVEVSTFENNAAYVPASEYSSDKSNLVLNNFGVLTSDSDISDVENGGEAKIIALKSRIRQSAANLLLVLVKVLEKKDLFGYWWALLPDSPNAVNWANVETSKRTLAYCAVTDPIASSRANVLSVILALLSGSRVYLSQAESSKRETASFIPFSVSLGYTITCMHKVLIGILQNERVQAVLNITLKCCAALIQATPYHKMNDGLITELVKVTKPYLYNRDKTLQISALVTIGCIVSIDQKSDEVLKAISKEPSCDNNKYPDKNEVNECDDFEEGYSDDEAVSEADVQEDNEAFKSWILDICFKNIGWTFKDNKIVKCLPSTIPVMMESLQVLSAIAFHHFSTFLRNHLLLLSGVLSDLLNDHHEVVFQASKTISVLGDAILKAENSDTPPPNSDCLYFWEKLLVPLSSILQGQDNAPTKAVVCDCFATLGERIFSKLSRRQQMSLCVLLGGSCSDEDASVRAAAVRAMAIIVMYRTLREDMCFLSDCGENILRALNEPALFVRAKAAWSLGNLSDALVLNLEDTDVDSVDDELLLRLLEVSIHCATDNDKIKMNATRSLGNLLRLINNENLTRNAQLRGLCDNAIDKLLDCACTVSNMKVRWNACYALGNAMKNGELFTCFNGWQQKVFPRLCTLAVECKNLKVRINAVVALRAPTTRDSYQQLPLVWKGIMAALENAANVHDYTEYKHKDNLIEQLCVTLAHLCCLLRPSDLTEILDPLSFHYECAKAMYTGLYHKLPPENPSCLKILEAANYVTITLTGDNETQQQTLGMLQELFIWDM